MDDTKRIPWIVVGLLSCAAYAHAQGAPGRILVSPKPDVILACNIDGSNCFHVTGESTSALDPGGGGDQDPSLAYGPSVAANGTIAFQAAFAPDGTCAGQSGQGICTSHVFVMDADGTNVRQITFNPPYDPATFFYGGDFAAVISPDGRYVAFVASRNDPYDHNGNPTSHAAVYVVNIDGSNLRQVTPFTFDGNGDPHGDMFSVAWRPDSAHLAFKGTAYGTECGTFFGSPIDFLAVGVVNVDGTGFRYLLTTCDNVNLAGGSAAIDWSPDGTLIADARSVDLGGPAIRFTRPTDLSAGGLALAQLSGATGNNLCPSDRHCIHFSPDSSAIAYENSFPSDDPSFQGVSRINLDASGRADAIPFGRSYDANTMHGIWWAAGAALPVPSQFTLAPARVEVWPGFSHQLVPSLFGDQNDVLMHTARAFKIDYVFFHSCGIEIGPYGLVKLTSISGGNEGSTISAANQVLVSNSVPFKCWPAPPCTWSLSPTSGNFPDSGGQDAVLVSADPGVNDSSCPWHAKSNDAWIAITSGPQGSGSGSVSYTVAPNPGDARVGTMTIADQTFTVNQGSVPPPSADLAIAKTDSPDPATVGSNLTYTITVTNNGPDTATGIVVGDTLAAGLTFVSVTPSQGSCSGGSATSCTLGSLGKDASATVTLVVTPTLTGTVSNTASVTRTESDPNAANDSATANTTVNAVPVSLTALGPARFWLGQADSVKLLKFDVLAEILVNGTVVGSGQLANVSSGGSTFSQAVLETVTLALGSATALPSGAALSIRPSVRASCTVKKSGNAGVARLWFNGQPVDAGKPAARDAGTRFDSTIAGQARTYFLRSGLALSTTAGAAKGALDVAVDDHAACPARPYTSFGTWAVILP